MRTKFEQLSLLTIADIKRQLIAEAQRMLVEDIAADQAMENMARSCCPQAEGSSPIAMRVRWPLAATALRWE